MPSVPTLQYLLKCIQNQFATEHQRNVVDSLDLDEQIATGLPLQSQIEAKFLENGVPAGLFNIGNTCFANAALQALMSCTPFTGYFVDQFDRLHGTVSHRQENISTVQEVLSGYPTRKLSPYVASELSQVISTLILLRNQNDSFSPSRLMNLIRRLFAQFAVGHQHDAQEFISCLLDRLHEELQYPLLQLVEETFLSREEEDEMTSSSTKSDYESCASLISEDSLYSLNADGTLVEQEPSFRLNGNGTHTSLDRDSAEDSMSMENGLDHVTDMSPSEENGNGDQFHSRTSSATSHDLHRKFSPTSHVRRSRIVTWRSIIRDLFYGDFAVSVECKTCGEISTRYESFQMLEVSIPTVEQLADFTDDGTASIGSDRRSSNGLSRWPKWMSLRAPHTKRRVGLMACLKHELKPEYLTGDNRYHCDACNQSTDAVKNVRISRLPEVLIVHLKRFKYESTGTFLSNFSNPDRKIHDLVDFPCDDLLDPTTFNVDFTTKYELRSVIAHAGSTLSSGHYTSFVKVGQYGQTAKWYSCNDADVNEVSSSSIGDSEAYMLFYVRLDQEKQDRIDLLNRHLSDHSDLTLLEVSCSPRCQQLFPGGEILGRFSDPNCPLVSKEWWSKLKWSNAVHRLTAQDFVCPHRLLLPGTLARLQEVCVPVQASAFEKLVDLFDGVPSCRLLHRMECALCVRALNLRPLGKLLPPP